MFKTRWCSNNKNHRVPFSQQQQKQKKHSNLTITWTFFKSETKSFQLVKNEREIKFDIYSQRFNWTCCFLFPHWQDLILIRNEKLYHPRVKSFQTFSISPSCSCTTFAHSYSEIASQLNVYNLISWIIIYYSLVSKIINERKQMIKL